MGFPRQEYWSGLPFPTLGESSWLGDRTCDSWVSCIVGGLFTTWANRSTGNKIKVLARLFPSAFGFFFFFNFLATLHGMWGLFPYQALNPRPLLWKLRVLTTGPQARKSRAVSFWGSQVKSISRFWLMPFPAYLDSCPLSIHLQSQQTSILKSLSDFPFQCHISSSDSDFPASLL